MTWGGSTTKPYPARENGGVSIPQPEEAIMAADNRLHAMDTKIAVEKPSPSRRRMMVLPAGFDWDKDESAIRSPIDRDAELRYKNH
jgi:hypothetical protein